MLELKHINKSYSDIRILNKINLRFRKGLWKRIAFMSQRKSVFENFQYGEKRNLGYLPNEAPVWWKTLVLGFQHAITMFPATVLLPLLVGFDIGIVLFTNGLSTITALILSRISTSKFIPLYYGSSFAYTGALLVITHADFGI